MESKLITRIAACEYLWNVKDKKYKNIKLKTQTWEYIAEQLNISVEDARKKWKYLRERYMREVKVRINNYGRETNASKKRTWPCFNALQFLNKTIKFRKNSLVTPTIQFQMPTNNLSLSISTSDSNRDSKDDFELLPNSSIENSPSISKIMKIAEELNYPNPNDSSDSSQSFGNQQIHEKAESAPIVSEIGSKYRDFGNYFIKELETLPEEDASEAVFQTILILRHLKEKRKI